MSCCWTSLTRACSPSTLFIESILRKKPYKPSVMRVNACSPCRVSWGVQWVYNVVSLSANTWKTVQARIIDSCPLQCWEDMSQRPMLLVDNTPGVQLETYLMPSQFTIQTPRLWFLPLMLDAILYPSAWNTSWCQQMKSLITWRGFWWAVVRHIELLSDTFSIKSCLCWHSLLVTLLASD